MTNGEVWHHAAVHPSNGPVLPIARKPVASARQRMLFQVAQALRQGEGRFDERVSAVLAETVVDPDLLHGLTIMPSPRCYTRHLIVGTETYCILAIVWMPGQMSPVHRHRAWCSLGVHRGALTETHFEPVHGIHRPQHGLQLTGARQLHPGDISHGPAYEPNAHRMANLGVEPAISIHVYGTAFDRLGSDLNEVLAN